jgi:hypothetical protein
MFRKGSASGVDAEQDAGSTTVPFTIFILSKRNADTDEAGASDMTLLAASPPKGVAILTGLTSDGGKVPLAGSRFHEVYTGFFQG